MSDVIKSKAAAPFSPLKTWGRIITLVLTLLLPAPVCATEQSPPVQLPPAGWEYAAFMRYALVHSPHLSKTALQLEIQRMDEDDSRAEMLPTLSLHATHYVSEGTSVGIAADPYSPFESYYSLKVRHILTEIAKLHHLAVLSEAFYTVAQQFFRHEHFNRIIAVQRELITLAEQKRAYAENRRQAGTTSQLEAMITAQELSVRKAELKALETGDSAILDTLTRFIDGTPAGPVALNTADIHQLLDAGPGLPEIDRMLANSPAYKTAQHREALQDYHIRLAYAAYLPTFSMEYRRPNILDVPDHNEYVFGLGASFSLWDGGKRRRNIARQKIVMEQVETETWLQKNELIDTWHTAVQNLEQATADLELSASAKALSALKLSQTQLLYEQDKLPLPALLDDTTAYQVAGKNHLKNQLTHDLAQLLVRHLSGDLIEGHIHIINLAGYSE